MNFSRVYGAGRDHAQLGAIQLFHSLSPSLFPIRRRYKVYVAGWAADQDPGKVIPRSMFLSTGIVAVFYALMGVVAGRASG